MRPLLITTLLSFLATTACAPQTSVADAPRNDLQGALGGQVDFAQTHVVAATRRIFDPFLVPHKAALVMFRPIKPVTDVDMTITLNGSTTTVRMERPEALPSTAVYDQENTFSGKTIEGSYPKFRENTFSYQVPWNLFSPDARISFQQAGNPSNQGSLSADKFVFMTPESEGLVLMNIKGCVFKGESTCRDTLDQFDGEYNPAAARIAAREMLSELPTQRLHLGTGKAYWPRIIAMGPDQKPHVYDKTNGMEWAEFGDKTLPAKVGMGNYWRAASNLGDKKSGYPVAITGQLLDTPEGMPPLPPGVAASCGGNSCNYPYFPDGFWHETGHAFGLPHDTPGRYEDWSYRAYDNVFLPNTHPDPHRYGLPVDYLGLHYFGHVLGSLSAPPWHPSTASAPLIDEFEKLGLNSTEGASWKRYIAPYTHQQTLRVQQRFGRLPDGAEYAELGDDHRPPAVGVTGAAADDGQSFEKKPLSQGFLDAGIQLPASLPPLLSPKANQVPVETAVPVHTLVATFSDPSHNRDGINQIYPAILSNYGNVFSPAQLSTSSVTNPQRSTSDSALMTVTSQCLASEHDQLVLKACDDESAQLDIQSVPPQNEAEAPLAPIIIVRNSAGRCLDFNFNFRSCSNIEPQVRWRGRIDLTNNSRLLKLQESNTGKFITPIGNQGLALLADSSDNELVHFKPGDDRSPHIYQVDVHYVSGAVETHLLYAGPIGKDTLKTAAFNVNSERKPVKAVLKVDDTVVHERQLEDNPLPLAISMGAEHGEQINRVWEPQWLYSKEQNACLKATDQGLKLATCNAEAIWRLPYKKVFPHQFDAYQPLDISGRCINASLATGECHFPRKDTVWWTRQDLTQTPSDIYLQELITGRFITTTHGSDTPVLAPLGQAENQHFQKRALVKFLVLHNGRYLTPSRGTVAFSDGGQREMVRWYMISTATTPLPDGSTEITLMNGDGQCLNDELRLQECAQPHADKLTWLTRKDLIGRLFWIRLQNKKNGKFLDVGEDGTVSLKPLAGDSQVFNYVIPLQ
ncbi:TagA domain-containing protein [Pseudomonas putida]|uniref:TagA domain-containing protein n=1 Tax=Pseudomonas putida TaxID=303 RepID=UPI00067A7B01|nr:TagA domain-containing protein [Pseudomonas putida]